MKDLALKYRPKTFDDVVGQEIVTTILKKQIETKTWKNVYLFCGFHGSGKTTCARIMANEINNGEGSPIEIDGASNNGVDNIRALIEDSQRSAIGCEYKTYILDEAQCLSPQAWSASLKLIEEPPSHCIFIFCTTNPEKIPMTILSRVQRFDFRKISNEDIVKRLEYIIQNEGGPNYQREALERIATLADGHLRDAIKTLERCIDNTDNLTTDIVDSMFGLVSMESAYNIYASILNGEKDSCLSEIDSVCSMSNNLKQFISLLTSISLRYALFYDKGDTLSMEIRKRLKREINASQAKSIAMKLFEYNKTADNDNAKSILYMICLDMCV